MSRAASVFGASLLVLLLLAPLASQAQGGQVSASIDFPNTGPLTAQADFLRGVSLLHDFAYQAAAESFRQAQAIAPDFAMAYWGEAMTFSRPLWGWEDAAAGRRVLQRLAPGRAQRASRVGSEREAGYLRAVEALFGKEDVTARYVAYREAMAAMAQRYPDDAEAVALYALALLGHDPLGEATPAARAQAADMLQRLFVSNPRHPGVAHYLIHARDVPGKALLALEAAHAYEMMDRHTSHALHMPSHVYLRLGRWQDALRANKKAWQVSLGPDADDGPDYHSAEWLHYVFLQRGQLQAARSQRAELEGMTGGDAARRERTLERMRARETIETSAWLQAPGIEGEPFLDPPLTRANVLLAAGFAAANRGDEARIGAVLEKLGALRGAARSYGRNKWVVALDAMIAEADGLRRLASGDRVTALARLEAATVLEAGLDPPHGPPNPFKPAAELLGEMLLALDRDAEAMDAFQRALKQHPRRAAALLGLARAAQRAGDANTAARSYRDLAEVWRDAEAGHAGSEEVRAALRTQ